MYPSAHMAIFIRNQYTRLCYFLCLQWNSPKNSVMCNFRSPYRLLFMTVLNLLKITNRIRTRSMCRLLNNQQYLSSREWALTAQHSSYTKVGRFNAQISPVVTDRIIYFTDVANYEFYSSWLQSTYTCIYHRRFSQRCLLSARTNDFVCAVEQLWWNID